MCRLLIHVLFGILLYALCERNSERRENERETILVVSVEFELMEKYGTLLTSYVFNLLFVIQSFLGD